MTPAMPEPEVLSPDELRDAWPALSAEERAEGLKLLPRDTAEDLFFSISPREQVELILALPQAEQRSWVRGLAPDDGLPVGLQVMAPVLADDRAYRVGAAVEAALDDRRGHPLLDQAPALPGRAAEERER